MDLKISNCLSEYINSTLKAEFVIEIVDDDAMYGNFVKSKPLEFTFVCSQCQHPLKATIVDRFDRIWIEPHICPSKETEKGAPS